jgi:DNA-binding NtrC family response regulator
MSLTLQAKLLRALQEREFEPVGSNRLLTVDVRIIAATSRDLEQMVADGQFRADLYYRLNVITLKTPPLRERPEDMALLADYLIEQICRSQGIALHGISTPALNRLLQHDWPGNVRELANVLERALLMSDGDILETTDLDQVMPKVKISLVPPPANLVAIADVVAQAERQAILAALRICAGNKAQTARLLGISRAALYEKIAGLGLDAQVA